MRIPVLNYGYPPLGGGAGVATAALAQGSLRLCRVRSRRVGVHQAGMLGAASYLVSALPVVRRLLRAYRYDVVHVFLSPVPPLVTRQTLGTT